MTITCDEYTFVGYHTSVSLYDLKTIDQYTLAGTL